MDAKVEDELYNIFCDNSFMLGIHKTACISSDKKELNDIFNKGLYSNGHVLSGGITAMYDIEKTVSFYNSFVELCVNIKQCEGYKNSKGCIILKIPKELKNSEQLFYIDSEGLVRILPEYIYGYISVNNMIADSVIHNHNYQNYHVTIKDKYNILFKAYKETFDKYGYNQAITALYELITKHNVSYFTGKNNKIYLSRYIAHNDIYKILAFGLNSDSIDMNDLINMFNISVQNSIQKLNTK